MLCSPDWCTEVPYTRVVPDSGTMEWCSHYGIGADASMYWSSDMQEHWSADGQCMKASPYSNSIPRHMMGYCSKFGSCAWACIKSGEKNLTPEAPLLVGYPGKISLPTGVSILNFVLFFKRCVHSWGIYGNVDISTDVRLVCSIFHECLSVLFAVHWNTKF